MKKYLVVFEAPCVGTSEELVQFVSDKLVSDWAWEKSVKTREYIPGSYDIYEIVYNHETHRYELVYITPEMIGYSEEVHRGLTALC